MLSKIGKKVMIFDGAMGTELQNYGLKAGDNPESLNITNADILSKIHQSYVDSNADFISTNTFGANRFKLAEIDYSLEEVILAAIKNARSVAKNSKVFFDIGPLGLLLEPLGTLTFDEAYEAFKEIVLLSSPLVDGFILETFTDLYELKAGVLAVKENSDKPVFALMSFDETKRSLTGTTPRIMVEVLEGLGVDVLGVNCSLGPKELEPIVDEILKYSHTPVMVQPNRGLPSIVNGKTTYNLEVDEFDFYVNKFIEKGISIIGGCCGTTPEFIKTISKYKNKDVVKREVPYFTTVTSATVLLDIDNVVVCGERLNPTGKKKLKEALLNENYEYLVLEGIKQEKAGAHLLDLNVGLPKIDEPRVMMEAVKKIQEVVSLPLQIDSSSAEAIEKGVRYYNGLPLINSVNGEYEIMDKIFPIAKKYGCVVLGLTLDHNGVPKTAEERFEIAKRIVEYAEKFGIARNKIIIDTLTLTASAEQKLVLETVKALKLVTTKLGVRTALGVSNVSFGLPNRVLLNKTFLTMAMNNGLNMPIMNPCEKEMMEAIYAYNVLANIDQNSEEYISKIVENETPKPKSSDMTLYEIIKLGLKDEVKNATLKELETTDPMFIINNILISALNEVGVAFDKGKIFLPQLIMSAEATKEAFAVISNKFPKSGSEKGPIVLATVKGDVHDIGKNIVKVILESYGYKVYDLGKDVAIQTVVGSFFKYKPKAIGLSALMTTTVISMEETIVELKKIENMCPIFVGGAVVTKDIAKLINADFYSKDALEFVEILKTVIGE